MRCTVKKSILRMTEPRECPVVGPYKGSDADGFMHAIFILPYAVHRDHCGGVNPPHQR